MTIKEKTSGLNEIPIVHYLWVGPPTRNNLSSIAGHDLVGPIQMAKALQGQKNNNIGTINPIKFWCLKKYLKTYEDEFAREGANIEVCAIEDLLEKERNDSIFIKHITLITNLLNTSLLKNDKESFVTFKDCFSLFLLATQGGYFFDTNIFPVSGKTVNLPQLDTVKTARSGFQSSNDFFMMFSPRRADPIMLKILEKWEQYPILGGLHAFSIDTEIPFFDKFKQIDESMGVEKKSYKSYLIQSDVWGLFYWTKRLYLTSDEYENYLKYSDIDIQAPYPESRRVLELCSLCYDADPKKNWRSIPFLTDKAFISDRNNIYYVDKKRDIFVPVYQGTTTIHDNFPHPLEPKLNHVVLATVHKLSNIMRSVNTAQVSLPYMVNIDKCTILHQAVLLNDFNKVQSLLKAGADLKLKATYELTQFPNPPVPLHLSAKELANYVGHIKIEELIATYEPTETYKQPISIEQDERFQEQSKHLMEQDPQFSQLCADIRRVIDNFKKRSLSFFSFNMMKKATLIEEALQQAENIHKQLPFNSLEDFLNYKTFTINDFGGDKMMSIKDALNFCRLTQVPKTRTLKEIESLYQITI
ncbi:ankyrin repeat domain-containing protein [Legionella gresilensis]|uniref:ankyrin repeat domain-containing protein n=1 Tax=Legionella gresilensis TaxID=91823 RepID=UPI0010410A46|nr:ankyrin repeat domain-containing protein [Legionella gresilensis]